MHAVDLLVAVWSAQVIIYTIKTCKSVAHLKTSIPFVFAVGIASLSNKSV